MREGDDGGREGEGRSLGERLGKGGILRERMMGEGRVKGAHWGRR